jgi:hypothetical protein
MATTNSNFVRVTATVLEGAATTAGPTLLAMEPSSAEAIEQGSGGVVLDKVIVDLGLTSIPSAGSGRHVRTSGKILGNYAKNGAALFVTSGTTGVTLDLTDLTSTTSASAGDTAFATVNVLVFRNLGTAVMTIAPGASNPSDAPGFAGTAPTLTIPAGSAVVWHAAAGVTVDATHKTIDITPTAGGSIAIAVGGA